MSGVSQSLRPASLRPSLRHITTVILDDQRRRENLFFVVLAIVRFCIVARTSIPNRV